MVLTNCHGEFRATSRTVEDARMGALCKAAGKLVREAAEANRLSVGTSYRDIFQHRESEPEAIAMLRAAMDGESVQRGSRDTAYLHNPDCDGLDDANGSGACVFMPALCNLLGEARPA